MTRHIPVLLNEILEYLACGKSLLDCTLGGGGHSNAFLLVNNNIKIVALDRDENAIVNTSEKFINSGLQNRFYPLCGNFGNLDNIFSCDTEYFEELHGFLNHSDTKIKFDKILVDLGISSDQLDEDARGFSFLHDGLLDMRMDLAAKLTAEKVVNEYSFAKLKSVFARGGMSKTAANILASELVKQRPFRTTFEFRDFCENVLRRENKGEKSINQHLAAIPFQAVRIEVNDEFDAIKGFLNVVLDFLAPQGRLAIISFHSLEDELIAKQMRKWARVETVPRSLAVNNNTAVGKLLTRQAILPTEVEVKNNSRARSARLRVFEKY